MKIVLQNRPNYRRSIAGDSIQLIKTEEYLIKTGVNATIDNSPQADLAAYDVVHLFNLIPVVETYQFYLNARQQNKKIVLSTIYWDPVEFFEVVHQPENFGDWWQSTLPMRREILNGTALILPNSVAELEMLKNSFGALPPAVVIPNAADRDFAFAKPDRFVNKYRWRDFLLTVGRICRRKNQISLIKVAKQLKLPLVIIGPVNDTQYYQECRRESAGHKVLYIDTLTPTELASAYAAAKVHALVSWYDTPGLVSLEAALAGCAIVTTDRGPTREYFDDQAFYCEPGDVASIAKAVNSAWKAGRNAHLKEKVLRDYTWEKVASITKEAYQMIL